MLFVHILVFLLGAALVVRTMFSAVQTIILPRGANDALSGFVFISLRRLFNLLIRPGMPYSWVDRIMAFYAPIGLVLLLPFWSSLVVLGYMAMYWALGAGSWYQAFRISGSSLLTLGTTSMETLPATILMFTEAAVGLGIVALLIAYLPSMYSAFSRREAAVAQLEVRAGDPPTAVEMLLRYDRIHGLERLAEQWSIWENWFTDLEESHTSLAALVFFRSPQPYHSWVTAAGAVLDAASLTMAAVETPYDPRAALCIRSGYLAFRALGDFFHIYYNPAPFYPREPISVSREEFDQALDKLYKGGVPLKADREQAWLDFAGWRVNYDSLLLSLAWLTLAPEAPWTGGRPYKS
jgi:hypothetical protein